MADITVTYKGSPIAEVSASGTTTLGTSGKYCEDDISISYVTPSSYILLGSDEVTVNTTNTSATFVLTMNLPASDLWTSAKIIYVSVRGKAGKRQGYFYGSDCWFINPNPANNSATTSMTGTRMAWYTYDANGLWSVEIGTTWYGVFAYDITNDGRLRIRSRYNASSTLTINDTFEVKVYALAWPDGTPFA